MNSESITQKRGREEYEITIGSREISYLSRVNGTEGKATIPFELLSRRTTKQARNNPFFRNASLYFSVLAVITVAFGFLVDLDIRVALLWGVTAGACYIIYRLARVSYEVFPVTDGRVFRLLRNHPTADQYRQFREELFTQRDRYLLTRYARIDIERPARLERRRIEWLHDEGVLEDDAYVTIVETIEDQAAR